MEALKIGLITAAVVLFIVVMWHLSVKNQELELKLLQCQKEVGTCEKSKGIYRGMSTTTKQAIYTVTLD